MNSLPNKLKTYPDPYDFLLQCDPCLFFSYKWWAADSRGQHHVAVLAVCVLVVVLAVIVAVMVFSLSLAQMRAHLLMTGHGASLHECHAGQHRFTAQQPSL